MVFVAEFWKIFKNTYLGNGCEWLLLKSKIFEWLLLKSKIFAKLFS